MSQEGVAGLGVPLAEFIKGRHQSEVARLLGVSQGAVSQMVRAERQIFVKALGPGLYEFYELKVLKRAIGALS